MFGIGPMELVIIALVAVIFIGPQKLPDAMKHLGRFFVQARRYTNDVRTQVQSVINEAEREIRLEELEQLRAELKAASPQKLLEGVMDPAKEATDQEQGLVGGQSNLSYHSHSHSHGHTHDDGSIHEHEHTHEHGHDEHTHESLDKDHTHADEDHAHSQGGDDHRHDHGPDLVRHPDGAPVHSASTTIVHSTPAGEPFANLALNENLEPKK